MQHYDSIRIDESRIGFWGIRCGQVQLAAAALHALDGIPVHSLALHSLHGDPSRTAEATLVGSCAIGQRRWSLFLAYMCFNGKIPFVNMGT